MELPVTTDDLAVHLDHGVLRLTMTRPRQLNALTDDMVGGLVQALESATTRDDVRVVVISGAGRAFSAGADVSGESPQDRLGQEAVEAASRLTRAVVSLDKPVVAVVNGMAAGVGCSLALACDLVVAAESASFLLAFSRIGLMPDGGATLTVAAAVGRAKAMRMALLGEVLAAGEAYAAGLVSHLVHDDELADMVERLLAQLAEGPPLSFAATKRAVNAATLGGLEDAFDREIRGQTVLLRTADAAEGMAAFGQKRRPTFRGE